MEARPANARRLKEFEKSQTFIWMVGYCVKTMGEPGSTSDVTYLAHNITDREVQECKLKYKNMMSQRLNSKAADVPTFLSRYGIVQYLNLKI